MFFEKKILNLFMGFQNIHIDKKVIQYYFDNNKSLKILFKNDTLVLEDKITSLVYELHSNDVSDEEIKKIFIKN